MRHVFSFIKTKFVLYFILLIISVAFVAYSVPMIVKQHELNKLQNQIQLIEAKIESNKQERLNCEANMALWNKDNELNRKMVIELETQYNNMVGFTEAWQPE